jgi:hypothetical protein
MKRTPSGIKIIKVRPLYTYSYSHREGREGEELTRERVRGAIVQLVENTN